MYVNVPPGITHPLLVPLHMARSTNVNPVKVLIVLVTAHPPRHGADRSRRKELCQRCMRLKSDHVQHGVSVTHITHFITKDGNGSI
jgi:hypothetical protein